MSNGSFFVDRPDREAFVRLYALLFPRHAGHRPDARLYRRTSHGPTNVLRNRYANADSASAGRRLAGRCVNASSCERRAFRTSNHFIDRYDRAQAFPARDVRSPRDAFAAAGAPDAIAAHLPGRRQRTLQIGRTANYKPRIGRSSTRPSSIAS
jgi:hypothetical protein